MFPRKSNTTPRATLAVEFKIINWHAQKCVTGQYYPLEGHSAKKEKPSTASSSTDPDKQPAQSTAVTSTALPAKTTQTGARTSTPVAKTEPTDMHPKQSSSVRPTSETSPLYVPDMNSDEIDLEATLGDAQIDAFQDEMVATRKRSATNDDTQDDDLMHAEKDKNQPSQTVEAKIFITKPPPTK